MCIRIPNNEGLPTFHVGNINPIVTIKILEPPQIYHYKSEDKDKYMNIAKDGTPFCVARLLSLDKYTPFSVKRKDPDLVGNRIIFPLLETIYTSISKNLNDKKILIDDDMNCLTDRIFRIKYDRGYSTELLDEIDNSVSSELVPYKDNGVMDEECKFYDKELCSELCCMNLTELFDYANENKQPTCDRENELFYKDDNTGRLEYKSKTTRKRLYKLLINDKDNKWCITKMLPYDVKEKMNIKSDISSIFRRKRK